MGDFDCSKPADGTPLMTCCQSIVPPVCRIATHTSVWYGANYSFFGAGCNQYLQREVYWYALNDPAYYGRTIQARNRPPRSNFNQLSQEGASFPSVRQPISTVSKTETKWIFTATLSAGLPASGLIRVEITLSNPILRDEIVNALRNLSSQFDISAFENPSAPAPVYGYYTDDGQPLLSRSSPGFIPELTCGQTEAIVAGLIVAQFDALDISGLEFGNTTLINGSSRSSAVLMKSRLEMPAAWCSYYVPVFGLNGCRPIRDTDRVVPVTVQCGTPVKTYYSSGGIVPLIAEQEGANSIDYAVVARCPGSVFFPPYPPCGP